MQPGGSTSCFASSVASSSECTVHYIEAQQLLFGFRKRSVDERLRDPH